MKNIIAFFILFWLCPYFAMAATYTLSNSSYSIENDTDYNYFASSAARKSYSCGGYTYSISGYEQVVLKHGDTIQYGSDLYYCCNNNDAEGYWAKYANTTTLPTRTCEKKYNWVKVGLMGYCLATQSSSFNRCANFGAPGIFDGNAAGGCDYNYGSCSVVTHCDIGKYMNNGRCANCPDGGTTAEYTNGGITNCYIPSGTKSSDSTGNWTVISNCPYVQ